MEKRQVVNKNDWAKARQELLLREKNFTRLRDELSQRRRELPWVKVEKSYEFEDCLGKHSLSDLFQDREQLIVYHLMYGPEWDSPCSSCSYIADNIVGAIKHLEQRNTSMVFISRAPVAKIEHFKKRIGWNFKWLSSLSSDFNFDYEVSFRQEQLDKGTAEYNFAKWEYPTTESPGLSVFYRDANGDIFHTYSCYARGLDMFIGTYHLLDHTPLGRNEKEFPQPMAWVNFNDS